MDSSAVNVDPGVLQLVLLPSEYGEYVIMSMENRFWKTFSSNFIVKHLLLIKSHTNLDVKSEKDTSSY